MASCARNPLLYSDPVIETRINVEKAMKYYGFVADTFQSAPPKVLG